MSAMTVRRSPAPQLKTLVLTLVILSHPSVSDAHRWSWKGYQFGNNVNTTAWAPPIDGATRLISFVDGIQYWPATDDDYGYALAPLPNDPLGYEVVTTDGNGSSSVSFRLTTWELPDYVGADSQILTVTNKRDISTYVFNVPDGKTALVITEVLSYWPGLDDDYAYAVRAVGFANSISVTLIGDFGRDGSSSATIRATMLYWPSDAAVSYAVNRIIGTQEVSQYWDAPCDGRDIIAVPTGYMTDVSKYGYETFDNLAAQLGASSSAGKHVNGLGIVEDAGSLIAGGASAMGGDPVSIGSFAFDLGKQMKKYIGLAGPDDRDDDFFLLTGFDGCRVSARIGDGNSYSLGEVTAWAIDFPY